MNTVITLTWQVWLLFFLLETKTAKAKSLGGWIARCMVSASYSNAFYQTGLIDSLDAPIETRITGIITRYGRLLRT